MEKRDSVSFAIVPFLFPIRYDCAAFSLPDFR